MQAPPLPGFSYMFIALLLGQADVALQSDFSGWRILERWGIAAVMGFIALKLWQRSEKAEADARKKRDALDEERLALQKQLNENLDAHNKQLQAMIIAQMQESGKQSLSNEHVASALHELVEKVRVIPCHKKD